MLTFKDFRDKGLLWALNRHVFHPRGYAVAFVFDEEGNVENWILLGNGSEIWTFDEETDDSGFERFTKFLEEYKDNSDGR